MKEKQLLNWIKGLYRIHQKIMENKGELKKGAVNQLHGYIESAESIIKEE